MYRFRSIAGSMIIFSILCFGQMLKAQSPKLLDYQSVIRDNNGKLLTNKPVTIRFSIIKDDQGGIIEYVEDHKVTTNQFGLVYLYIGNGTPVQGSFLLVDWSKSPKYLKVEIDISGNEVFTELGTIQLVSVPFALFAEKSGSGMNAGKGILIRNDTILNTGDLSNANELQSLSVTTSGKGIILSDGGGTINFNGSGGTSINNTGNTLVINSETYTAGTGIILNGNTFSVLTSSSLWNASKLQGYELDTLKPSTNQILKWNGSKWTPTTDDNTTYTAGTGLSLTGTVFSNQGDLSSVNELQSISASGTTNPVIDLSLGGGSIFFSATGGTGLSRTGNNISINSMTYDAGTGITLSGNTFSHLLHTGDISGITSLTVLAIQGRAVSSAAPSNNQTLKWNGAEWAPANDDNTTYSAGTGLSLTGTVFSNQGDISSINELQSISASGATNPVIDLSLGGGSISFSSSGGTNLSRTGNNISINTLTYDAGTGITLSGNTFSHPQHSGDISGITSITVIAIQGRNVSTIIPSSGNVLSWNGSIWTPAITGLMPDGISGQTLRHDGNYWVPVSSLYNDGSNIGINTTNPMQKLQVEGNFRLPETTPTSGIIYQDSIPFLHSYGNNVFLGKYAGNFSTSSASNIGIGQRSLNNITSGTENLAIGYNSLKSNTTGNSNISLGYKALYNNNSGSVNVSIGSYSLYYNASGFNNVAIGYNSLYSNSTGNENIAIGNYSMSKNATGIRNTALGYFSLSSNGSGNYNTSVGYRSLCLSYNVNYNSAFGSEALTRNITGTGNTAIGANSMYYNYAGSYNTAIGMEALYTNSTGNYNTAFGGYSMISNATGNNNSALGYYALGENYAGSHNTALGEFTASSTTTGSANTGVGSYALITNQTGDSNTAIGSYSGVLFSSFNNATAIGNKAIALSPNSIRLGNTAVINIGGQVSWSTASDGRFKTNVNEYKLGLEFIMKLHPVSYEYTDYGQKGITYNGFIAQEVEQILDEHGWQFSGLCKPAHDKDRYSLRYAEFVVPLVNAVQEEQLILVNYQQELNILRKENAELKNNYQTLSYQYSDLQKQLNNLKLVVENIK